MRSHQTPRCPGLPRLWLLSDARNDTLLETALRRLPRGSGFIFRHYHLPPAAREARFRQLSRMARGRGIVAILAGSPAQARRHGARGSYGPAAGATPRTTRQARIATAHSLSEIGQANRARADAILLSPVFPTRSHPDARPLGSLRFRLLARHALAPVIALGGMTRQSARRLRWPRWAAIDGLS